MCVHTYNVNIFWVHGKFLKFAAHEQIVAEKASSINAIYMVLHL
jgi:hypothetical protein